MTAKEYLSRLKIKEINIDQLKEQLAELRTLAASVSAVDVSGAPRATGSSISAGFTRSIEKIETVERDIDQQIADFTDLKITVVNQIQGLSKQVYKTILYKHFVLYKDLQTVAEEMELTYPYVVTLHGYALKEFEKRYLTG